MDVVKNIVVGVLGLLLIVFAFIGVLYSFRGTPVERVRGLAGSRSGPAVGDVLFRRTAELLTTLNLAPGNRIELFINGDQTYPRLWDDVRSARRSLTVQMYYFNPGTLADTLSRLLVERAQAGVRVLMLIDAFGAQKVTNGYLDTLKAGGVHVAKFRPVHWYSLHKAQSRSHIRVVVVDGAVAYTGGFGIDDKWLGDGRRRGSWRDTNVRFTGPAVLGLQAAFAAGWAEATGELLAGEMFFPAEELPPDGDGQLAGLLYTAPTIGSTPAERFLAFSIASARKTLYITNSYFVPDDDFREMLADAARRGVDVRILTTSDDTDVKTTWLAGRAGYEELLEAGVRVYEYQPTMIHAKTIVADGVWGSVGTMNFDNRSLAFNDETNLIGLDPTFGTALDSVFVEDLRYAKEIKLEAFRRRPWYQKVLERGASMLGRML